MSTWKRALSVSLAIAVNWAVAPSAQGRPTVLIRMYEGPAITTQVMGRSRARFDSILTRAGIDVVWQDCPPDAPVDPACNRPPQVNEMVVRLVSGTPPGSRHACGMALVPSNAAGHYITLFPDCVRASAEELRVSEDVVIAFTLAHEMGHQLLGPRHSALGLMQARPRPIDWARAAHDGLVFSPSESRRLQDALARRGSSQ